MLGVRMRAAVLAAALLLGAAAPMSEAARPARPVRQPTVVVAVADTGVNPYHEVFYRPAYTRHPCTWVVGFTDCSVPALNLSIGRFSKYEQAREADQDVWDAVEPGQWYWIPRTNIIGAVCDTYRGGSATASDPTCILDDDGHGTGTASSVLSEAPDALLLVHDGKSSARHLATAPVVPDVRSHSWGPAAPLPLHATDALPGDSSSLCDSGYAPQTVFFLAAGNEAPFPTMLDCTRQPVDVQVVGGSFPGYWNYNSWSGYDFASWFCRPFASHELIHEEDEPTNGCGTSFAAPTAAGTAADAMLRIRRKDRYAGRSTTSRVSTSVTRDQFIQALRDGATYAPDPQKYPGPEQCDYVLCYTGWAPMAPGTEYAHWGYGWLDSTVTDMVVRCALRRLCPPKSAEAREHNERRQAARQAGSQDVVPPAPQDDAGSGRDAGSSFPASVLIKPGVEYAGHLEPYGLSGDVEDWYVFRARAGQSISVSSSVQVHPAVPADLDGIVGCWTLYGPDDGQLGDDSVGVALFRVGCDSAAVNEPPTDIPAETSGTYRLVYTAHNGVPPHDYRFAVRLR